MVRLEGAGWPQSAVGRSCYLAVMGHHISSCTGLLSINAQERPQPYAVAELGRDEKSTNIRRCSGKCVALPTNWLHERPAQSANKSFGISRAVDGATEAHSSHATHHRRASCVLALDFAGRENEHSVRFA